MQNNLYTYILFLGLFIAGRNCGAQNLIPNPSFEIWNSSTSVKDWNAINFMGINLVDITKVTDAKEGSFAAKITSKQAPPITGQDIVIPGMLLTGNLNISALMELISDTTLSFEDGNTIELLGNILTNGVPISATPETLDGYYKYTPAGAEENCAVGIILYSSASGTRIPIGGGIFTDSFTSSDYERFSIPVTYLVENIIPDEMIVFAISSASMNPQVGSSLIIDKFSTTLKIGIKNTNLPEKASFKVYPNPSKGSFVLDLLSNMPSKIRIYNTIGKLVWTCKSYQKGQIINLKKAGIYNIQVITEKGVATQTITVQ